MAPLFIFVLALLVRPWALAILLNDLALTNFFSERRIGIQQGFREELFLAVGSRLASLAPLLDGIQVLLFLFFSLLFGFCLNLYQLTTIRTRFHEGKEAIEEKAEIRNKISLTARFSQRDSH